MVGKISITEQERQLLGDLHAMGVDNQGIAQALNKNTGTIAKWLLRFGLESRPRKGGCKETNKEIQEQIIKEYKEGKGATTLAKTFGVDKKSIYNILARAGIGTRPTHDRTGTHYHIPPSLIKKQNKGRPRGPRKKVNEKAFDVLTKEGAYWVGFLMADGCVYKDEYTNSSSRIHFGLSTKDIDHVMLFRQFLGSQHKITHTTGGYKPEVGGSSFVFSSDHMAARLLQLGVTPRKSGGAFYAGTQKPGAEVEKSVDFWRGCIDGNGCIYEDGSFYLSGTQALCLSFKQFVLGISPNAQMAPLVHPQHGGCYNIEIKPVAEARKILSLLYIDCTVSLGRKRERALKAINKKPWG